VCCVTHSVVHFLIGSHNVFCFILLLSLLSMYGRKRVYAPAPSYGPSYRPFKRYKSAPTKATYASRTLNKFNTSGARKSGSLKSQVKSLQKVVNQLKPELKYHGQSLDTPNISNTGTVVHLTTIAQGDNQPNRTGNVVAVRKLDIGFIIDRLAALDATDLGNAYFRWAVVVDKEQISDTLPGAGDIFEVPSRPYLDHPALPQLERFRYLYVSPVVDLAQVLGWNPAATTAPIAGYPTHPAHFSFCWNGEIKVGFNSSAGTDIEKNGIYLVLLAMNCNAHLDISGSCRVGFTDV